MTQSHQQKSLFDDDTVSLDDNYSNTYETLFSKDIIDIASLTTADIESISLSDLGTMNSSITYGSGTTYPYPPVFGGSGAISGGGTTGIYVNPLSPNITLSPNTNITWANPTPISTTTGNGVYIQGDADIKGKLKVQGKDIGELLATIEDRLAIYHPAPELEEKWEVLRDLARQYKETLADIKEKEQIFDILKK